MLVESIPVVLILQVLIPIISILRMSIPIIPNVFMQIPIIWFPYSPYVDFQLSLC